MIKFKVIETYSDPLPLRGQAFSYVIPVIWSFLIHLCANTKELLVPVIGGRSSQRFLRVRPAGLKTTSASEFSALLRCG